MIKHRVTFHPLLLLAALLFLPAYSTAGHVEDDVAFRVYYLFEPADEKQLQRAASAYRATLGRDGVEWIGIRRSTTTAVPFAPLALADLLATTDRLALSVAQWLRAEGTGHGVSGELDLVEKRTSRRSFTGTGAEIQRLSEAAGLPPMVSGLGARTDVGVTTWGKVKELFR